MLAIGCRIEAADRNPVEHSLRHLLLASFGCEKSLTKETQRQRLANITNAKGNANDVVLQPCRMK